MMGGMDLLFLLGADELDMSAINGSVVYIGSHGDAGAHTADVILPAAAYTEKSGTWVNTEGRVQMGSRANFAPGEAKEDWAILRALSGHLGQPLPFDSLSQLRSALYADVPHMTGIGEVASGDVADIKALAKGRAVKVLKTGFKPRNGFLHDQSDRPRLKSNGGMFAIGRRCGAPSGRVGKD